MCQSIPIRDETADVDPFGDMRATLNSDGAISMDSVNSERGLSRSKIQFRRIWIPYEDLFTNVVVVIDSGLIGSTSSFVYHLLSSLTDDFHVSNKGNVENHVPAEG